MLPTSSKSPTSLALPWSPESSVAIEARHPIRWGLWGVVLYELARSFSTARLMGWLFMVLFPVALVWMAKWQFVTHAHDVDGEEIFMVFAFLVYALIPQVATMLCLLLWATPSVNAELEAQTWIYALVRPHGRTTLVLGKCLVAMMWAMVGGLISTSILVPLLGLGKNWLLWWTIVRLLVLASVAYSALYILIGTLFQRRAMVAAFVYTIAVEGFLSFLPATINQLTVSFRLRNLLIRWLNMELPSDLRRMWKVFDVTGSWHDVVAIFVYALICLAIAMFWLRRGEYPLQPEAT